MKACLMGIRVWPSKDKMDAKDSSKIDIAKNEYTELTLVNLDSGDVELYNVSSEDFAKFEIDKEDFARFKVGAENKIHEFDTKTAYGKTKIMDCTATDQTAVLSVA